VSENKLPVPPKTIVILKRIFWLALPVSLASIMLPIGLLIDLYIVPKRLIEAGGYSVAEATELYGFLTGMAAPLINMATILTASLAASLVPAISEAFTLDKTDVIRHRISTAVRVSSLITIPAFVGLFFLSGPISKMLFNTWDAGPVIGAMSLGIFFLGLHQISTAVLQGLGRTSIPVIMMIIAALGKIALNWILTGYWGVVGASWASVADYAIAAILNIVFVYRFTGYGLDLEDVWRPGMASVAMGIILWPIYSLLFSQTGSNTIATFSSMLLGTVVFSIVILLNGGVRETELVRIPVLGARLAAILKKLRILR
jgi:stage V sporulation protein B